MNVLLVYPRYPDTFWSFKHALSFLGKKASIPPLGLLTVASLLPKEWELKLVDMNVGSLKDADLIWADMVFVGAMIVQKNSAMEVLKRAKSFGKKTVVGGPYFTSCDRNTIQNADHFVLGEAEITLPEFLQDLKKEKLKAVYSTDIKPGLAETPTPRWDLIRFKDYATLALQYTRGCPFDCEFCDITKLYGKKTRLKSAPQFVNEVDTLYKAGFRGSIFVVDDNFVGNMKETKVMLPHLIKWQEEHTYPVTFLTEASVNLAKDKPLMELMRKAGFTKVFLGIETPHKDSLKECKKGQNVNIDLVEMVRTIQVSGMEVLAGFIVGFDKDPHTIFDDQIAFIQKAGIPTAMVGLLTALPKTELWKRLQESGRLIRDSTGDNLSAVLNFVPIMDRQVLLDGYRRILATIYSDKHYYARVHALLRNLKPMVRARLQWCDVRAFVHSVVRIGVFSKTRFRYWRLILTHCARKTFPRAVELAIMGEHFKKVALEVVKA